MKKTFRTLLCAAMLVIAASIPAFAAEGGDLLISPGPSVPQRQGDFYVLVNGEYVTFADATPQIRNDRSCLPFVAVFDQLGFAEEDMTWDGETSTVTATKGNTTIKLTVGSNTFSTERDRGMTADSHGKPARWIEHQDYTTEAAPYIDPATNRTYVPFGLVADALGYSVGWDAAMGAVIIDDVDAILAANEATYELMDKYMAYCKTFYEKNQQITGSYAMDIGMDMATAEESAAFTFDLGGKYEMLMAGPTALQFNTDMTMDMTMKENGADVTGEVLGEAAALFPLTVDLDMRGDMAGGVFYFQSAALAQLMEQPGMSNAWYKMDLKAMFDQMSELMGMDYAALMELSMSSLHMSFEQSLSAMLKAMPLTSAQYTTSDYLAIINTTMADSAFKKSGSTYVSTLEENGAVLTFTLYTSGSKVNGYAIDMTAAAPAFGEMKMEASMRNNKMKLDMAMDMGIDTGSEHMKLNFGMTMDGVCKTTSKQPATQPPQGAAVIDLMQLAGLGA